MSKVKENLKSLSELPENRLKILVARAQLYEKALKSEAYWTGVLHTSLVFAVLYFLANITIGG